MKAVDLFSGCGGLSLGLQEQGVEVALAVDNWAAAVSCYNANFEHEAVNLDLSDVGRVTDELSQIKGIDMIAGGPPCQDFSHAGKRKEGGRADLTQAFARVVANIRPRWFLMENVDRAAKSQAFKQARNTLKEAGYGLTETVLDASKCGLPQKRKRFFCIGKIGEVDGFLTDDLTSKLQSRSMTVREYFGDSFGTEYFYRHPRNYNRRGVFSVDEPAPTVRGVNRPIPNGYPGHPNDPVAIDQGVKALTTQQRAMLQTFPDSFSFSGTKTTVEQMIGNAVPVKLAAFVVKAIMAYETRLQSNVMTRQAMQSEALRA